MDEDNCLKHDHRMHTIMFYLIVVVIILLLFRLVIDILICREKMKQ